LWNMNQMDRTENEELNSWSKLFCISWCKKWWSLCNSLQCLCIHMLSCYELMVRCVYICRLLLWHCRFNIICTIVCIVNHHILYRITSYMRWYLEYSGLVPPSIQQLW
jgi:hypothetical protein